MSKLAPFRCRPLPKNRKGVPFQFLDLGSRLEQSPHYVQTMVCTYTCLRCTRYMAFAHLQPIHHDDVHLLSVFLAPHESQGVSEKKAGSWLVTTLT